MTPGEGFEFADFETCCGVEHVVPKFGREHDTSGEDMCWCHPDIEVRVDGTWVVTHSAEH